MTPAEVKTAANISLLIAGIVGVGMARVSASKLPWYSAIGAGILSALAAFVISAMFFSIEVPK